MGDFYKQTAEQFGGKFGSHAIVQNEPQMPRVLKGYLGNEFVITPESAINEEKSERLVAIPPSSSAAANFLDAGEITFKLKKTQLSMIDRAWLMITVRNADANPCTIAPVAQLAQWIQFRSNTGNNTLYQIQPEDSFFEAMYEGVQEWISYAPLYNTNVNYAITGNAIAAGVTTSYYLPIRSFLGHGNLHISSLAGDGIEINVKMNPASTNLQNGVLPLTSDVRLLIKGWQEPDYLVAKRELLFRTNDITSNYLGVQRFTDVKTYAASTSYDITLTSLKGTFAYLWIGLRPSSPTASTYFDFSQTQYLTNVDIVDSTNTSKTGSYPRSHLQHRSLVYPSHGFNNQFAANTGAIYFPFANSELQDFELGSNHGWLPIIATDKIVFQTSASLTPGSYQLLIVGRTRAEIKISKGYLIGGSK